MMVMTMTTTTMLIGTICNFILLMKILLIIIFVRCSISGHPVGLETCYHYTLN